MDLIRAIKKEDIDEIKETIKDNIHYKNDEALCWSIKNGKSEITKLLIDNGANVHARKEYAIRIAALNGDLEMVKYLLTQGVNLADSHYSSVKWAIKNQQNKVLEYMINQINMERYESGLFFVYAAECGNLEACQYLDRYVIRSTNYNKAAYRAVKNNHYEILAHITAQYPFDMHNYGRHVINMAITNGNFDIFTFLYEVSDGHTHEEILYNIIHRNELKMLKYMVEQQGSVLKIFPNYVHIWCLEKEQFIKIRSNKKSHFPNLGKIEIKSKSDDIMRYFIENGVEFEDALERYSVTNLNMTKYFIDRGHDIYVNNHIVFSILLHINSLSHNKITKFVDYLLSIYSRDKLKEFLSNEQNRNGTIRFLLNRTGEKYHILINILLEYGVDYYDICEKEL